MRDGYWALRKYKAGKIGESVKYWVPGKKPTRSQRRLKSDIRKQTANEHSTEKTVARIIHANFRGGRDILLGLDYSEESHQKLAMGHTLSNLEEERERIYAAAEHQMELFIRRVKRICKQEGVPLRYIAFTSDMDGRTKEPVRVHHHIVINREALEFCRKKWSMGGVDWEILWDRKDQSDLAAYLVRQARKRDNAARYIPSRNLIRPQPKDRIAISGAEIRPPKGAELLYRSPYRPGQAQYIRYVLPDAAGGGSSE